MWVADLTYVAIATGFVYLAVILDAWSRRVVGYTLSRRIDTRLALAALRAAVDIAQSGGLRCEHRDSSLPADLDASNAQNASTQTSGNRRHRHAA